VDGVTQLPFPDSGVAIWRMSLHTSESMKHIALRTYKPQPRQGNIYDYREKYEGGNTVPDLEDAGVGVCVGIAVAIFVLGAVAGVLIQLPKRQQNTGESCPARSE
jgi:uncharacterized membrane protein